MSSSATSRLLASGSQTPGVPQSFSVAVSTTAPKSLNLSWSSPASIPGTSIDGYRIYRGATLVSTQTSTSFTDSGLDYNTSYTYSVYSYNSVGNSKTSATASNTTSVACNNASGQLLASGTTDSTSAVTVPAGCFKVRIRALSGGGGGQTGGDDVHFGSCRGVKYNGGGGGAYIDGVASMTPGANYTMRAGGGGNPGVNGGISGIAGIVQVNGGSAGGAGGTAAFTPAGATVTSGGNASGSFSADGGAAALSGSNPAGVASHGGTRTQGCGACDGCRGSTGNGYGGGGSGGTDSGALYGETAYAGGPGAPGYVVWNFSES